MKGFVNLTALCFLQLLVHNLPISYSQTEAGCPSSSSSSFLTVSDFEKYAQQHLPKGLRDYIVRGAGDDLTMQGNREAFAKFKIFPRYLRDISNRSTAVEIFGRKFAMPIGISPSGLHKRWHADGENATVQAIAASGSILILSSASSITIEQVAAASPEAEKWLQTFIFCDRAMTDRLIGRAEAAGFHAIVLTVDMSVKALRYFNTRNEFKDSHSMVNIENYDGKGIKSCESSNWDDVKRVVGITKLPVLLKGILTAEDAILAKSLGVKGVIVSNHGGRQLDGAISSIEALYRIHQEHPELTAKGNGDFDIFLDSGVRSGLDVFRALAFGAKFVFVGRPPLWGLYHSGQNGVETVLEMLRRELETVMGQAGCATVDCIEPSLVKYYA